MNFQQLRIIHETVRQNYNLTEAANALFTSQSGVSKHIKDLEDELGIELFVRKGKRLLGYVVKLIDQFRAATDKLETAAAHGGGSSDKHAKYMRDTVVPAMAAVREVADRLEGIVPDDLWQLPKYAEILFIK